MITPAIPMSLTVKPLRTFMNTSAGRGGGVQRTCL
jgi:hypothetical protein